MAGPKYPLDTSGVYREAIDALTVARDIDRQKAPEEAAHLFLERYDAGIESLKEMMIEPNPQASASFQIGIFPVGLATVDQTGLNSRIANYEYLWECPILVQVDMYRAMADEFTRLVDRREAVGGAAIVVRTSAVTESFIRDVRLAA